MNLSGTIFTQGLCIHFLEEVHYNPSVFIQNTHHNICVLFLQPPCSTKHKDESISVLLGLNLSCLNCEALQLSKTQRGWHQYLEEHLRDLQRTSLPVAKMRPSRLPKSPKRTLSLSLISIIMPVSRHLCLCNVYCTF